MPFLLSGHNIDSHLTPIRKQIFQFALSPIIIPVNSGQLAAADITNTESATNAAAQFRFHADGFVDANGTVGASLSGDYAGSFGPGAPIIIVGDWHETPANNVGQDFEFMAEVLEHNQIQFNSFTAVNRGTQTVSFGTWQTMNEAVVSNSGNSVRLQGNSAQGGGTVIANALMAVSIRNASTEQVLGRAVIQFKLNQ